MTQIVPSIGFLDDSVDFLQSLRDQESVRQLSIRTTERAAECLEWVKQGVIDVLVADLRLPSGSGLTILEEAQKIGDVFGILLTGYQLTAAEQAQARQLGVTIFRKDALSDLLDYLERFAIRVEPLEMLKLRRQLVLLESLHEEWSADLVSMLREIPCPQEAIISSDDGPFTVAQLIDDIEKLRPRGREYMRLWRRTVGTFLRAGHKP
jgi:CheY-like chemotaxis protein